MSWVQRRHFNLNELSLTLWHCGRVCVYELVIVVVDGVLEFEIAEGRGQGPNNQTVRRG